MITDNTINASKIVNATIGYSKLNINGSVGTDGVCTLLAGNLL